MDDSSKDRKTAGLLGVIVISNTFTKGTDMKKVTKGICTSVIVASLVVSAPMAMAKPDKGNAKDTVALCKALDDAGLLELFGLNRGNCVSFFRKNGIPVDLP